MGQSASIGQGSIGADELKVTGDGSSGQVLASDGDGTFTWTTDTENYLPLAGGALTGAVTTNSTFDGVDIATRDAILSSTTTTAGAALPKAGGAMTGAITTNSTFDGVDIATRDGILSSTTTTANAALPKAGGTMTGNLTVESNQLYLKSTSTGDVHPEILFEGNRGGAVGQSQIKMDKDSGGDDGKLLFNLDRAGTLVTYLNLDAVNQQILLKPAGTTALTLDSSQNATFAGGASFGGNVTISGSDGSLYINDTTGTAYSYRLVTGSSADTTFEIQNATGGGTPLKILADHSITFLGNATVSGRLSDTRIYNHLKFVDSSNVFQGGIRGAGNEVQIRTSNTEHVVATFNGTTTTDGSVTIFGGEDATAALRLYADEGDDDPDKWKIEATQGGVLEMSSASTGSFVPFQTVSGTGQTKFNNDVQVKGKAWGTFVKTITTSNNGTSPCRFIWDEYGLFMLVGRFKADASGADGIQAVINTVDDLSTSTSQSQTSEFSAEWGSSKPTEVRIMGSTDFDNWKDNVTIDWVYGVPKGREWKHFFTNGNSSGMTHYGTDSDLGTSYGGSYSSARWGFTTTYAYDGKGRWYNPNFVWYRMSDANPTITAAAFTTPTTGGINFETAGSDAKLGVHWERLSAGQDVESSAEFGNDDNDQYFDDDGFGHAMAGMSGGVYSSAVWVLIKLGPGYVY